MKVYEKYLTEEEYKVAKNPNDKKWYVVGRVGKNWMPISDGFKNKQQAEKYMKGQKFADDDMRKNLLENVVSIKDFKKQKKQKIKELAAKEVALCSKMIEYIGYYRDGLMDKASLQRSLDQSMKGLR